MAFEVDAIYENGVLKPDQPLPLTDQQRVHLQIQPVGPASQRSFGLVPWTGSLADLDYLINSPENDPLERS
jgi:hypothetical protein